MTWRRSRSLPCFSDGETARSDHFTTDRPTDRTNRPGLHWITPFGANVRRVSTTNRTMELPNLKVADKRGNPVLVSAILNYRVTDAKRAILNVANVDTYIRTNAQASGRPTRTASCPPALCAVQLAVRRS